MQRFKDKTVVVTGGGGGIGGATCRRFAREGATVAVFDLNLEAAEKVAAQHPGRRRPARRRSAATSPTAPASTRRWRPTPTKPGPDRRAGQQRRLGRVQALHQDRAGAVGQADRDQPDRRAAHASRRAARHGGAQGRAASSTSRPTRRASAPRAKRCTRPARAAWCRSPRPSPANTPATASRSTWSAPGRPTPRLFADYKEGAGNPEKLMEAFTRSIPLGRIGQPDDLPGAILFFASDDAGFVTGQVLSVSGGLTMNG